MLKARRPARRNRLILRPLVAGLFAFTILLLPMAAHAQSSGSPFDTGFTAIQTLFTGTLRRE